MSEHAQQKPPINYDELFPGRFLKAGLFQGKDVTLEIVEVNVEALPQDDGTMRKRGIITFRETPLQLVLNSTNGQCLRALFGTHIPDWLGKRVTFRPEKDRFGREMVDAIRIAGSPDLSGPVDAMIRMPRKKDKKRTLVVTKRASTPDNQPPSDDRAGANPDDPDSYG